MSHGFPIPRMVCEKFDDTYVPTCLSNGLIGFSPNSNPLLQSKVVVGGFVFSHPKFEFENFALAPYPLGMDIRLGNSSVRRHPEKVTIKKQILDMETGELNTMMIFQVNETVALDIEIIQFASRSSPSLICQEVILHSDQDLEVRMDTFIDHKCISGSLYTGVTDALTRGWYDEDLIDRCMGWTTDRSRLGISTIVIRRPEINRIRSGNYIVRLKSGEARIQLIAAMVPELYNPDPHLEAVRLSRWGEMLGFDKLKEYNRQAWAELWKSRIKIDGPADDQKAVDIAYYYYHSNVHSSTRAGTPPFGLTQHDMYYGHNFWDTDIWLLIPAILTAPEAAKSTVDYRFKGLEAAKQRAALYGYRGAMYAWETSVEGWDVTPSNCPTAWAQHHTTPGVAIGVWEYQLAAGDEVTLRERTWPILKSIAEWIESRGHFTEQGFEIQHMMGPDEGITNVSNQTYFNLLSKMAVTAAIQCAVKLGYRPPALWKKVVDNIVIPMDEDKKVVLPYDLNAMVSVHNSEKHIFEIVSAADNIKTYSLGNLHFLFIHNCPVDIDVFKNTYFHEEEIRLAREPQGGVPGSTAAPSFTSPAYAACAAFFGERKKAAELFRNTWEPYSLAPFGMIREYQSQNYGSYITSFGSILQYVLLGFTGLRIQEDDWIKYPARLPEGWHKISIDQIWVKGRPMRLSVEHGKPAQLTPINT